VQVSGVIVRFEFADSKPSLVQAAQTLGVPVEALSAEYGVQRDKLNYYHVHLLKPRLFNPLRGELFSNPGFSLQGPPPKDG